VAPRVASPILTEIMLVRFRERAPGYDPIHPTNSALTHEVVAKLTLGIDPTRSRAGVEAMLISTGSRLGMPGCSAVRRRRRTWLRAT
jgi:hypothetical protein